MYRALLKEGSQIMTMDHVTFSYSIVLYDILA